jgi:hypothetical protein
MKGRSHREVTSCSREQCNGEKVDGGSTRRDNQPGRRPSQRGRGKSEGTFSLCRSRLPHNSI